MLRKGIGRSLAAPGVGVYWGNGRSGRNSSNMVLASDVPPALRYALGRMDIDFWHSDGCLGYPWGSFLTKVAGDRSCNGVQFRQLQYSAHDPQGAAGRPVPIFPDCRVIADPYSPLSGCSPRESAESERQ